MLSSGLAPGSYQLVVFGRSSVSHQWAAATRSITIAAAPRVVIESPAAHAVFVAPFTVRGWALDRATASAPGIDAVHVYAYHVFGTAAPIFLGVATYGVARPDIGAMFGTEFTNSGYQLDAANLSSGVYYIVAFARSTSTGTFSVTAVQYVTVASTLPLMAIDEPFANATTSQPFNVRGWAVNRAAPSGTGTDAIHVWAYPVSGGSPILAGVATYGTSRPDVGAVFGSQFTDSGYLLSVSGLPAGSYNLYVFAHDTISGDFTQSRIVQVTVQ